MAAWIYSIYRNYREETNISASKLVSILTSKNKAKIYKQLHHIYNNEHKIHGLIKQLQALTVVDVNTEDSLHDIASKIATQNKNTTTSKLYWGQVVHKIKNKHKENDQTTYKQLHRKALSSIPNIDTATLEHEIQYLRQTIHPPSKKTKKDTVHVCPSVSHRVELTDIHFPDPDPSESNKNSCFVNNVTQMSQTCVERIVFPRNTEDVKHVLCMAREQGRSVSIRGTKHSMGGQTMKEGGFVIDTEKMNHMQYNVKDKTCTVGPGATWADMIYYLNEYGMSPRTMQSYSSFSVGGTVSVNGHGITTDYALYESIVEFKLVLWNGKEVLCKQNIKGEGGELFGLVIGGYGMFGVMVSIVLKVQPNTRIWVQTLKCSIEDFPRIYNHILEDKHDDIEIKISRLDVIQCTTCNIFIFRRVSKKGQGTISPIDFKPRELSNISQLLFKWVMPSSKHVRRLIEDTKGEPLDLYNEDTDRNQIMYESATPLAKMYSPLFRINDSFVLQEYFIPNREFVNWIHRVRSCVTKQERNEIVTLLNITIRYVHQDNTSILSYSKIPKGSFAFVLYFRIERSVEADSELKKRMQFLIKHTLEVGGSFYLPYRHHYTHAELTKAYPAFEHFILRKQYYDPYCVFDSEWFSHYASRFSNYKRFKNIHNVPVINVAKKRRSNASVTRVSEQRKTSMFKLMASPSLRTQFFEAFLVKILNIEKPEVISRMLTTATCDPTNENDLDVYESLCAQLRNESFELSKTWKSILQLRAQKKELTRETASILNRLGRFGSIHDYVSIGDVGKTVLNYKETFGIDGKVYVVNNRSAHGIADIIMQGSEQAVGEFVHLDFENPTKLHRIESNSVDLITMHQGLHHLSQQHLLLFLKDLYRILRNNGLFLVREHDLGNGTAQMEMLDAAHLVFNAVTGEPLLEEKKERRAFRPILEWRQIIESIGFVDSMLYEMEDGDPTLDEMMCFIKKNILHSSTKTTKHRKASRYAKATQKRRLSHSTNITLLKHVYLPHEKVVVNKKAEFILNCAKGLADDIILHLANAERVIYRVLGGETLHDSISSAFSHEQQCLFANVLLTIIKPFNHLLLHFRPMLDKAIVVNDTTAGCIIAPELWLTIQHLLNKRKHGNANSTEMIASTIIMEILQIITQTEEEQASTVQDKKPMLHEHDSHASALEVSLQSLFDANTSFYDINLVLSQMQLPQRALQTLRSKVQQDTNQKINIKQLVNKLTIYLDEPSTLAVIESVHRIVDEGASLPSVHTMLEKGTSWNAFVSSIFSSKTFVLTSTQLTMMKWIGLGSFAELYNETNRSLGSKPSQKHYSKAKLSEEATALLNKAVHMVNIATKKNEATGKIGDQESLDTLNTCMEHVGVIPKHTGNEPSSTFYKLNEWMQVEISKIYSDYIYMEPWFRFPFKDMMITYFKTLLYEFSAIVKKYGMKEALLSQGLFINIVPGFVMALQFAQLELLKAPCVMYYGDAYTPEEYATHTQRMLVLAYPNVHNELPWKNLIFETGLKKGHDVDVDVKQIVPYLYMISLPRLPLFTDALIALSHRTTNTMKILRIADHNEIQIRVSFNRSKLVEKLCRIEKVELLFSFKMPVDGTHNEPWFSYALCVDVTVLLPCIRNVELLGGRVDMVFDFWKQGQSGDMPSHARKSN